jgi:hypothetical protein
MALRATASKSSDAFCNGRGRRLRASWNCTKIYDILEGLQDLEEVVLANPLRPPNNNSGRLF